MLKARKAGNTTEVSMIRTLIASIENSQAVEAEPTIEPKKGLGHDIPRRELTSDDVTAILLRERTEVVEAIDDYRKHGLTDQILDLEIRLSVVERYLSTEPPLIS